MKVFIVSLSLAVVLLLIFAAGGRSEDGKPAKAKDMTSNQMLMRDKLTQMNRVLEGLTLDKYDQVQDAAKTLRMISRATTWHVVDPTPRYERLSKNFQEQTVDLERHAKEHNVDAATLDLVRMNVTLHSVINTCESTPAVRNSSRRSNWLQARIA